MQILLFLAEESEAMIAKQIRWVERACWSKAALPSIADALFCPAADVDWPDAVADEIPLVIKAFGDFPWHVDDLVEEAPELCSAIAERNLYNGFIVSLSKRKFLKTARSLPTPDPQAY